MTAVEGSKERPPPWASLYTAPHPQIEEVTVIVIRDNQFLASDASGRQYQRPATLLDNLRDHPGLQTLVWLRISPGFSFYLFHFRLYVMVPCGVRLSA